MRNRWLVQQYAGLINKAITGCLLISYLLAPIVIANQDEPQNHLSTTQILINTSKQERLAYLELAMRYASGELSFGKRPRAAISLYQTAATLGYPGIPSLDNYGKLAIPLHNLEAPVPIVPDLVADAQISIQKNNTDYLFTAIGNEVQDGEILLHAWHIHGPSTDTFSAASFHSQSLSDAGDYTVTYVVANATGRLSHQQYTFSIEQQSINDPVPIEPTINQALTLAQKPIFHWTGHSNNDSYQLEVLSPDESLLFASGQLNQDEYCDNNTCSLTLPIALLNGQGYRWTLQAFNQHTSSDKVSTGFDVNLPDFQNFCEGHITDSQRRSIPFIEKPSPGETIIDPSFGVPVTRITNSDFGEVKKPMYSSIQAWNADETRFILYHTGADASGAGHYLYDGNTYQLIRKLDIVPSDIEEIFWSYQDPDSLFYLPRDWSRRGEFVRYSISTNDETVVTHFSSICPNNALPVAGADVQMHAHDDDLFSFRCAVGDGTIMFSYRLSTNEITQAPIGEGTPWISWLAPNALPRGDGHYLSAHVLDLSLAITRQPLDMGNSLEHSSLGLTATGNNALYQVAFNQSPDGCDDAPYSGVGHLIEYNLDTGACRPIISQEADYPYPNSSTHLSALAYRQPGWVALSSVGSNLNQYFFQDEPAPALLSEIYLADTRENGQVCRLAHHRSSGRSATNADFDAYFSEPHVTLSPSGTRLLFGSDWYDSGSVDTYVIDLRAQ